MAVALDDAIPGERRKLGTGVLDQFQRRCGRADFGDRRTDRGRQTNPPCDRALHFVIAGRDDIDEIGIDQER